MRLSTFIVSSLLASAYANWVITLNFGPIQGWNVGDSNNVAGFGNSNPSDPGDNYGDGGASLLRQIAAATGLPLNSLSLGPPTVVDGNVNQPIFVDDESDPSDAVKNITRVEVDVKLKNGQENVTLDIDPNVTRVTPRTDDNANDTVLILGIVFGVLGGILVGVAIYFAWKKSQENEKAVGAPSKGSTVAVMNNPVHRPPDTPSPEPVEPEPSQPDEPEPSQPEAEPAPAAPEATAVTVEEPAPADPKPRDDIADERARYAWNAAANSVADKPPGGHPTPEGMADVVERATIAAANEPPAEPKPRDDIADERARYNWNATANAVADPAPGGHPTPEGMADVVEQATQQQQNDS